MKNSKGEVLVFLDDDDVFLPNKLKHVYNIFLENKNLIYYNNNNIIIFNEIRNKYWIFQRKEAVRMSSDDLYRKLTFIRKLRKILKYKGHVFMSSIAVRRFDSYNDIFDRGVDHYFFYKSLLHLEREGGEVLVDVRPLTIFRILENTSTILYDINKLVENKFSFYLNYPNSFNKMESITGSGAIKDFLDLEREITKVELFNYSKLRRAEEDSKGSVKPNVLNLIKLWFKLGLPYGIRIPYILAVRISPNRIRKLLIKIGTMLSPFYSLLILLLIFYFR